MSQKIKRIFFTTLGVVFCVGCFGLLFFRLFQGQDTIQTILKTNTETEILRYYSGANEFGHLVIPVSDGIEMEDVTIENQYMSGKFLVTISGMDGGFIRREGLAGSLSNVTEVRLKEHEKDVCVEISVDGVFSCRSEIAEKKLCLWFERPKEVYEKCIVIDVAHGGESSGTVVDGISEKAVLLEIAHELKKMLDKTAIQVYYTRLADTQVTLSDRIALAQAVDADMLISLQLSEESEDALRCGILTYYNGVCYNNDLNSGDLAYFIEESVVDCSNAVSLGIESGEDKDYLIHNATVPTAVVTLGYLTNTEERSLLVRKDYQKKLARGLYEGILAAYEEESF